MAESDLLLLGTIPCIVVGQINMLGALCLDGIVEDGEDSCVVCVNRILLELLLLLLPPNCKSCCNSLSHTVLLQRVSYT